MGVGVLRRWVVSDAEQLVFERLVDLPSRVEQLFQHRCVALDEALRGLALLRELHLRNIICAGQLLLERELHPLHRRLRAGRETSGASRDHASDPSESTRGSTQGRSLSHPRATLQVRPFGADGEQRAGGDLEARKK